MIRAKYTWHDDGRVVSIVDEKGLVSVTNDVEAVMADFAEVVDLNERRVIYRDSFNIWDGIAVRNGRFLGFMFLRKLTMEDAIVAAWTHPSWPASR